MKINLNTVFLIFTTFSIVTIAFYSLIQLYGLETLLFASATAFIIILFATLIISAFEGDLPIIEIGKKKNKKKKGG